MNDKLISLMADLREEETIAMVKELIKAGVDPLTILDDARHRDGDRWEAFREM